MNTIAICAAAGESRAALRRRKLIDTARGLFIENGFHATGMAQIAQQSGIAVGQIYRDFVSKEDIVAALVQEDCARYTDAVALQAAIDAADRAAILAWLHHFVEPGSDSDGDRMFAEIVAESSRNARIAEIFKALQDELREQMLAALGVLVPSAANSADLGVLADAVLTLSLGLLQHRLFRPGLETEPLVTLLRTMITDHLANLTADTARTR